MNNDWGSVVWVEHLDFPPKCEQCGGVGRSSVVRPGNEMELFDYAAIRGASLKISMDQGLTAV